MRLHLLRLAVLAAGPVIVGVSIVTAAVVAAPASLAAGSSPPTSAAATGRSSVFLISGAQVTVIAAAGSPAPITAVRPTAGGPADALLGLRMGGRSYQIPGAALPYLGRGLDPSLFDVATLLRGEAGGRLPVRVTYHGRRPALPGVTITHAAAGTAAGYLTVTSAKAFGAALTSQYLADHACGSYGSDGLFADGVSIALAGAVPAKTPVRANLPTHTLTVTGTDQSGKPDTGTLVFIINADNGNLDTAGIFEHGVATFSVPSGHYWAESAFADSGWAKPTAVRMVELPQFTVAGPTTVHIDERAATSKITVVTPRPAVLKDTFLELDLTSRSGPGFAADLSTTGTVPLWVSPIRHRATAGTLRTITDAFLTSPRPVRAPYLYAVAFSGTSGLIPPSQRHVVRPAGLATVDARYYSAVPTTGQLDQTGIFSGQAASLLPAFAQPLPGKLTEYLTGGPAVVWLATLFGTTAEIQQDSGRSYRAGQHVTEMWNAYPLHVGVNVNLVGGFLTGTNLRTVPSASRAGDKLTVAVDPFSDNLPGHFGSGFFPDSAAAITGSYEIDQNGTMIASGSVPPGRPFYPGFFTTVTLSPQPATIRFALTASRAGAPYPLSPHSVTVWTWRSAHEAGVTLPPGWACGSYYLNSSRDRHCAAEPMMTLRYAVAGMALDGSVQPGRQVLSITAGHLQLARASQITGAAVQVSFDSGRTWQRAAVTGHAGNYLAAYSAPATARYVTLRMTATDAADGQVTETIIRAYKIAS